MNLNITTTIPYDLGNGVTGEATLVPTDRDAVTVRLQVPHPGKIAAPWDVRVHAIKGWSGGTIKRAKVGGTGGFVSLPRSGPWRDIEDEIMRTVVPTARAWIAAHPREMALGEAGRLDDLAEYAERQAARERNRAAAYRAQAAAIRAEIEEATR